MLVISWFICGALFFLLYSYLFSTLVIKQKFNFNIKNIISIVLMGGLNSILISSDIAYLKPYLMHLASFILLRFIYKEKNMKTMIGLLFIALLSFIAELAVGLIIILIMNINLNNSNNELLSYLIINLSIFVITMIIGKFRFTKNIAGFIIDWYNKNEYVSLMIFTFCTFTISIFLLYNNFINI